MNQLSTSLRSSAPQSEFQLAERLGSPDIESLPPVHGPLPYTRDDYAWFPAERRTAAMDFLILGKIPEATQNASLPEMQSTNSANSPLSVKCNAIVKTCLFLLELDALEFFWSKSGIDPAKSTISLSLLEWDQSVAEAIADQCRAHAGMKLNLNLGMVGPNAAPSLADLIKAGNVQKLSLGTRNIEAVSLVCLAPVLGEVGDSLLLRDLRFDLSSEAALGHSLGQSTSLKQLTLHRVRFEDGDGALFFDGMGKNQSIGELTIYGSTISTNDQTGLSAMLKNNATLEKLEISCLPSSRTGSSVGIDVILKNAAAHPSLRSLSIKDNVEEIAPSVLHNLLETNVCLSELHLDVKLPGKNDYPGMVESLKNNYQLTEFSLLGGELESAGVAGSVEDTLARNRAAKNTEAMRQVGMMAFDPFRSNGLSEIGPLIAQHLLEISPSFSGFVDKITAIHLSVQQQESQALKNGGQAAEIAATVRVTAGEAATTTTTTLLAPASNATTPTITTPTTTTITPTNSPATPSNGPAAS